MPKFEIDIVETLQKRVEVEAETMDDAIELVSNNYYEAEDDDYILTADNATVSVEFEQVDFTGLAKKTADYLYSLSDDCPAELRQPIATLRQLINEEYVGKDKTVGSQLIWDILGKAIQSHLDTKVREAELRARIDELAEIRRVNKEEHDYSFETSLSKREARLRKELTQEQTQQPTPYEYMTEAQQEATDIWYDELDKEQTR